MKYWVWIRTVIFILAGIYISFFAKYDREDWEFYLGLVVIALGIFEIVRISTQKKKKPEQKEKK